VKKTQWHSLKCFGILLAAYYVAWAGPKRAILVSNILIIPSLWALVTIDTYTIFAVFMYFFFQACSFALYYIASDVQFSSINHTEAAGKEVGWLYIMERVGTTVAPIAGGLIALFFGPEKVMLVAAILSIASALPLFLSPDKVHRHQKITFRGLPVQRLRQQFVSSGLAGVDYMTTSALWSLFIALTIFGTDDNSVYAKLGMAFTISLIASIVTSHVYGIIIDHRRASTLFKAGIVINALIHLTRPFITTPAGVATLNAANEAGTSAYNMPYVRTEYDEADNLPGYRIAYLAAMWASLCFGAALMAAVAAGLVWKVGAVDGLKASFIIAVIATLFMLNHGFSALRRSS
jgi:MFS family permease